MTTIDEIRLVLTGAIDTLERMRKSYRTMLGNCNYVVQLEGGFLRCSGGAVSLVGLDRANTYTFDRATVVANAVSNGNGKNGKVVLVQAAIAAELDRLSKLLVVIDGSGLEVAYGDGSDPEVN